MLKRITMTMLVVSLAVLIAVTYGSTVLGTLGSSRMVSIVNRADMFLNEYAWALRLWRYGLYAAVFLFWARLGRKARARDRREWTDDDVSDWNRYRYRLLAILIGIDIVIIDQWPLRLIGVTS